MITIRDRKLCSGCSACASRCPKQCISMLPDSEGFLYPHIDNDKCVDCGLCEKVCPIANPITVQNKEKEAYAAYCTDDKIRRHSSSGGVFTLLAEEIISNGGVVFGAALSLDCKSVIHIAVDKIENLELLRGSKYVQSSIGDTYKQAKEVLESGHPVLFSGTPCQIGGLYSYLGKDYSNLYTQDLICHGVPSPKIWEKYVELREKKAASKTRRTFFRHKKYGWKMFSVLFDFTNCTEYINVLNKDIYIRGFLANLYLRPSCYECAFKGANRPADITLADFWGIEHIHPEMDDNKGTSFVVVHSEKGRELFNSVKDRSVYKLSDINEAANYNSAMIKSVEKPQKREDFFLDFDSGNFEKTIKKYTACKISVKVLKLTKRAVKKILRKLNMEK